MKSLRGLFLLALFVFLCGAAPPLRAQEEPGVDDYVGCLPEQTVFYVSWKNLDDFEQVRATNPLFRFVDSPEMKQNWQVLVDYFQRQQEYEKARRRAQEQRGEEQQEEQQGEQQGEQGVPSEQTQESQQEQSTRTQATSELEHLLADPKFRKGLSLFTNPGLVAVVFLPPSLDEAPAAEEAPPHSAQEPRQPRIPEPQPAVLVLYDTTGKEKELDELANELGEPGRTQREYDLDGTTVHEILDSSGKPIWYVALLGPWYVSGDNQELTEAWIRAVRQAPAHALKDTAAYQHAAEFRDPEAQFELFFNVSAVVNLMESFPVPPGQPVTPAQVVEALGLDRWSLVHFTFGFGPESVRYQGAVVQSEPYPQEETIIGSSVPGFASLDFAPKNAFSFAVQRWNLTAAWNSLQSAVEMLVPPQQAHLVRMFQGMAEGLLGMPIGELAAAWGPEFAQISYPVVRDESQMGTVNVIRLQDRQRVLTALQNLLPLISSFVNIEEILPDNLEEDVVWFRLSAVPGQKEDSEALEETALVVALTPEWLLMGSDVNELRRTLEQPGRGPSLRDNPIFQQVRSRLPAELSSLSFLDIERFVESGAAAATYQEFRGAIQQAIEEERRQQEERERQRREQQQQGEGESEQPPDPSPPASPAVEEEQEQEPPPPDISYPELPELTFPRGYLRWSYGAAVRDAQGIFVLGYIE